MADTLLYDKAKKLLSEVSILRQSMNEVSEWNSVNEIALNMGKLYTFFTNVVLFVQEASVSLGGIYKSEDKLNAAVKLIDDAIKFPFYIDVIDGPIIKVIVSTIVAGLNKDFGKIWNIDSLKQKFSV